MSTFALDRNYQQFNFEEISVEELQVISGGSGSAFGSDLFLGGGAIVGLGCIPGINVGLAAFALGLGVTMMAGAAWGSAMS